MKQIRNAKIYHVCLPILQAGVVGDHFIPFIYHPKIESTIYFDQKLLSLYSVYYVEKKETLQYFRAVYVHFLISKYKHKPNFQ